MLWLMWPVFRLDSTGRSFGLGGRSFIEESESVKWRGGAPSTKNRPDRRTDRVARNLCGALSHFPSMTRLNNITHGFSVCGDEKDKFSDVR